MYHLPQYKEKDRAVVIDFMKQHPFAMLVGVDAAMKPVATQVPILVKEKEGELYLQGHIMKATDHCTAFETNRQALALFTGAHAYVSASWYENKQQASTWNYMTVHAQGELCFLEEEQLLQMLEELTAHFENDPSSPAAYKALAPEYITRMAKAIVAFEIKVDSLEHVFKLSQNRDQRSFENIVEKLEQSDADAKTVAVEMNKRKEELF